MANDKSEQKIYTLPEDNLVRLINKHYTDGVLTAYQLLHNALQEKTKDQKFSSSEEADGYNRCIKLVESMMASGVANIMKHDNKGV